MRIVFLNPSGQLGGAEICLLDMIAVLREKPGWEIHLIVSGAGPLVERASALGARVEVLPFPPEVAALGDSRGGSKVATALRMVRAFPAVRGYRARLTSAI